MSFFTFHVTLVVLLFLLLLISFHFFFFRKVCFPSRVLSSTSFLQSIDFLQFSPFRRKNLKIACTFISEFRIPRWAAEPMRNCAVVRCPLRPAPAPQRGPQQPQPHFVPRNHIWRRKEKRIKCIHFTSNKSTFGWESRHFLSPSLQREV